MTLFGKDPTIEKEIQRAENHWRWLRVFAALGGFGVVACLLFVAFGGLILLGWVADLALAHVLLGLLVFGLLIAAAGVVLIAATGSLPRNRLVSEIEGANPPMMDRLNTVVAFEKNRPTAKERSYLSRIVVQASQRIRTKRPSTPFRATWVWVWLGLFFLTFAGSVVFWLKTTPWTVLAQRIEIQKAEKLEELPELDLSDPETNVTEFNSVWGDVRISEPGKDLTLTKVDVAPLQIEAASNQALKSVQWASRINGGETKEHPLDPPSEPNYAAYQPVIYLDEYGLSDWDVLSYYASAKATNDEVFSSEIYFIEIRPFREDILKMQGQDGQEGDAEAFDMLSLLTGLIDRQREILKETHRFAQRPPASPDLREQDRKKLETSEADLAETTTNAYAKLAAMENMPVGEALDHLGKAEGFMKKAVGALQDNSADDATQYEMSALSELVATRKMFQKTMSENAKGKGKENQPPPDPVKDLKDIAEYRDKEETAQEGMQELVEKQQQLSEQAGKQGNSRQEQSKMAQQQQQIQNELNQMKSEFPEMFEGMNEQMQEANQAMSDASKSMSRGRGGQQESQRALDKLQDLQNEMQNLGGKRDLQHAYQLKKSLDEQIKNLEEMAEQSGGPSSKEQKSAAGAAQSTMEQMKEIAEKAPKGLGPELKESLEGEGQKERQEAINRLSKGQQGEAGKQAAEDVRDSLKQLSQSFEKSQPATMKEIEQQDPLKSGSPEQQMEKGEQQLDGLVKRLEEKRLPSGEELKQQLKEIKGNLEGGLAENSELSDRLGGVLEELEKLGDQPATQLTPEQIQKLLAQLDTLRVEIADSKEPAEATDMTHMDPEKWPAQYRERIRKYFEKLSEQ